MKLIYWVLPILGLILAPLFNCKSTKSKVNSGMDWIKIGDGGGFTGKETVYTINTQSGSVESEGKSFKKLKSADLNQWMKNFYSLGVDQLSLNEPGNRYQFIELNLQGKTQKLVWNPSDQNVPKDIHLIYDHLNHLVQKASK